MGRAQQTQKNLWATGGRAAGKDGMWNWRLSYRAVPGTWKRKVGRLEENKRNAEEDFCIVGNDIQVLEYALAMRLKPFKRKVQLQISSDQGTERQSRWRGIDAQGSGGADEAKLKGSRNESIDWILRGGVVWRNKNSLSTEESGEGWARSLSNQLSICHNHGSPTQ